MTRGAGSLLGEAEDTCERTRTSEVDEWAS
jgi:hypothetical protein